VSASGPPRSDPSELLHRYRTGRRHLDVVNLRAMTFRPETVLGRDEAVGLEHEVERAIVQIDGDERWSPSPVRQMSEMTTGARVVLPPPEPDVAGVMLPVHWTGTRPRP